MILRKWIFFKIKLEKVLFKEKFKIINNKLDNKFCMGCKNRKKNSKIWIINKWLMIIHKIIKWKIVNLVSLVYYKSLIIMKGKRVWINIKVVAKKSLMNNFLCWLITINKILVLMKKANSFQTVWILVNPKLLEIKSIALILI